MIGIISIITLIALILAGIHKIGEGHVVTKLKKNLIIFFI